MQGKLNQWLAQVDGKAIEAEDASNYAQCFDLAFNWCDFLGIPRDSIRHLDAFQIYTSPNPDTSTYWDIITNTPTGVPQAGDLIIWGTGVGSAGHVAIFKTGDANMFHSEDQNWSGIQKARDVSHSYNSVLGWLHPKGSTTGDMMQISKSDFEGLMKKAQLYDAFVQDNFPDIASVHKAIDDLVRAGQAKDTQIAELQLELLARPTTTPPPPLPKPLPKATPNWLVTFINKLLGK